MATFLDTAIGSHRQAVYVRRPLAGGKEKYERLPFDYVKYDDGSGYYVEPVPMLGLASATTGNTWYDIHTAATEPDLLISDRPPFNGVTEIR